MKTYNHIQRWELPKYYMGASWPEYFVAPCTQNRDSDALERSNFRCMLAALKALPPWSCDDEEAVSRHVVSESHFLCGWVEWIAIHETDTAALDLAEKLGEKLENYPVLNEEDFSREESDEANEVWRNCYRSSERIAYIRRHRSQFEFHDFSDLLAQVRGKYFGGYASELIN